MWFLIETVRTQVMMLGVCCCFFRVMCCIHPVSPSSSCWLVIWRVFQCMYYYYYHCGCFGFLGRCSFFALIGAVNAKISVRSGLVIVYAMENSAHSCMNGSRKWQETGEIALVCSLGRLVRRLAKECQLN